MQQAQLIFEAGRVKCRMTSCSRNVLLSMEKYCFLKEIHILNILKQCHIKRLMILEAGNLNISLE